MAPRTERAPRRGHRSSGRNADTNAGVSRHHGHGSRPRASRTQPVVRDLASRITYDNQPVARDLASRITYSNQPVARDLASRITHESQRQSDHAGARSLASRMTYGNINSQMLRQPAARDLASRITYRNQRQSSQPVRRSLASRLTYGNDDSQIQPGSNQISVQELPNHTAFTNDDSQIQPGINQIPAPDPTSHSAFGNNNIHSTGFTALPETYLQHPQGDLQLHDSVTGAFGGGTGGTGELVESATQAHSAATVVRDGTKSSLL
jgi:hypothetical protein